MHDPYNLQCFVDAQKHVFEQASSELREGRKTRHWTWFIFPRIKGLGHSETTRRLAISSREETEAYVKHPVLGPRLRECTRMVLLVERRSAPQIFGFPSSPGKTARPRPMSMSAIGVEERRRAGRRRSDRKRLGYVPARNGAGTVP